MNEFQNVTMDEMNDIVGGSWLSKVGNFLEKVAVAVATALVIKKVT